MATYNDERRSDTFSEENYVLVAAIDFGTTYSGYAFSFKSSPDNIKMNKNWSEQFGFQSYKTPTCVLTGPDHTFMSFGYEAEHTYTEIMADEELSHNHHMYRHFKMMLYDEKKITRDTLISSVGGHKRRALDIFVMALKYLKKHLLDTLRSGLMQYSSSNENMIKWVITVPAIWNDEAKQFMREAAFQAELIPNQDSRQLLIALEPEAASLFCRSLDINHFVGGDGGDKTANFRLGSKYMVIDAGGGTIDITVHEVLANDEVKEIHSATGGTWGGKKVDERFIELLKRILSDKFVNVYMKDNPQQWLAMMTNFEKIKKSAKPDGKSKLVLPLSWSMGQKYQEIVGSGIEVAIKNAESLGVGFANGAFILNNRAVVDLFDPVVMEIVAHVDGLYERPEVRACEYFLLVGGFAESLFLQNAIEKKFANKICLLVPNEAQMSVIKGAVLYGHRPESIKSRISKKTYGVSVAKSFNETLHDRKYYVVYDGIPHCKSLFDPYAQIGEELPTGSCKTVIYYPTTETQTVVNITLHTADIPIAKEDTVYVDRRDIEKVGKFIVDMPDTRGGRNREIKLNIEFGGTEIQITGTDVTTGNVAEASIDFLSE